MDLSTTVELYSDTEYNDASTEGGATTDEFVKYAFCHRLDFWESFSNTSKYKWKDIIETVCIYNSYHQGKGPATPEEFIEYNDKVALNTARIPEDPTHETIFVQNYRNPFKFMQMRSKRFVFELNETDKEYFINFVLSQCYVAESFMIDTTIYDDNASIFGKEKWDGRAVETIENIIQLYESFGDGAGPSKSEEWEDYYWTIVTEICGISVDKVRDSIRCYFQTVHGDKMKAMLRKMFGWTPKFEVNWFNELTDSKCFLKYHHYSRYDALPRDLQRWFCSDYMVIRRDQQAPSVMDNYIDLTKYTELGAASMENRLQMEFWNWIQRYNKYLALYMPKTQALDINMETFQFLYCKLLNEGKEARESFLLKWYTMRITSVNISCLWTWVSKELRHQSGASTSRQLAESREQNVDSEEL